jgi:hypothetical protein
VCLPPQQRTKPASAQLDGQKNLSLAFNEFVWLQLAFMTSSSDGVRCTIQDGSVWLQLDNVRVNIPSHIVHKSKMFNAAVSSVADPSIARGFTLAAPKEWLQAWLACYGSEEDHLGCADRKVLVNCLMVSFCSRNAAPSLLSTSIALLVRHKVHCISDSRLNAVS